MANARPWLNHPPQKSAPGLATGVDETGSSRSRWRISRCWVSFFGGSTVHGSSQPVERTPWKRRNNARHFTVKDNRNQAIGRPEVNTRAMRLPYTRLIINERTSFIGKCFELGNISDAVSSGHRGIFLNYVHTYVHPHAQFPRCLTRSMTVGAAKARTTGGSGGLWNFFRSANKRCEKEKSGRRAQNVGLIQRCWRVGSTENQGEGSAARRCHPSGSGLLHLQRVDVWLSSIQ